MKAVILVGGQGTRLRPLTCDIPKPLVPICGKPFMEYQIELIKEHGIDEVIFSLGYKSSAFEEYFGDGTRYGMKFHHVVESEPLGTAGAVKFVEDRLEGEETFLVFNGDVLSRMNLTEIIRFHSNKGSLCTIILTPVDNPTIYGVVELDEQSRIIRFTEKPKPEEVRSNWINAGLYVLHRSILDRMEKGKNYSIERQIFPRMLEENIPMFGWHYEGYWMDIGTPRKYLSANIDMLKGRIMEMPAGRNGLYGHVPAEIGKNVEIHPPLWTGSNVRIADGAVIQGPTVIGNDSQIGRNARISEALLWDGVRIGDDCMLNDCIVGRNAEITGGTTIDDLKVIASFEKFEPIDSTK